MGSLELTLAFRPISIFFSEDQLVVLDTGLQGQLRS